MMITFSVGLARGDSQDYMLCGPQLRKFMHRSIIATSVRMMRVSSRSNVLFVSCVRCLTVRLVTV